MVLNQNDIQYFTHEMEKTTLFTGDNADDKALHVFLELWERLPAPKHQQPAQISNWIIDSIYDVYMNKREFNKAKEWAIKALNNDTAQEGAYEYFQLGRVCYELNELDEALSNFEIAYQRGKYRAFQEFDKKYWTFYSENKKSLK